MNSNTYRKSVMPRWERWDLIKSTRSFPENFRCRNFFSIREIWSSSEGGIPSTGSPRPREKSPGCWWFSPSMINPGSGFPNPPSKLFTAGPAEFYRIAHLGLHSPESLAPSRPNKLKNPENGQNQRHFV